MLRGRHEIEAVLAAAKTICGYSTGFNRAVDLRDLASAMDALAEILPRLERLLSDWPEEGTGYTLRSRNGRLLATFPTRGLLEAFERVCPFECDLVIEETGV